MDAKLIPLKRLVIEEETKGWVRSVGRVNAIQAVGPAFLYLKARRRSQPLCFIILNEHTLTLADDGIFFAVAPGETFYYWLRRPRTRAERVLLQVEPLTMKDLTPKEPGEPPEYDGW